MLEEKLITHYVPSYIYPDSFIEVPITSWNNGIHALKRENTIVDFSVWSAAKSRYGTPIQQTNITLMSDSFNGSAPFEAVYTGLYE